MIEILYKRSIGGKILYWKAHVISNEVFGKKEYRIKYEHGELNTDNPTISYSDYIYGKNIGKRNETTDHQQAIKECKSLYDRQKKKGYKNFEELKDKFDDKTNKDLLGVSYEKLLDFYLPKYNTDANNSVKPMKAQPFVVGKFKYPALCQPKINGVRATISYDINKRKEVTTGLFDNNEFPKVTVIKSKEGLVYNIKHIESIFDKFYYIYSEYRDIIFDGEIYIKDEKVTGIGGAARNELNPLHSNLQFICFDLSIPDLTNEERDRLRYKINSILNDESIISISNITNIHHIFPHNSIIFLKSEYIYSDNEALRCRDKYLKEGFEGAIIRDKDATYAFGSRPKTMMKLKKFKDKEFKILDLKLVDSTNNIGVSLIFICENDRNDLTFESSFAGTADEKRKMYLNKNEYIGKLATVKYGERTKNNLPFHSNVIGIRDYE